MRSIIAGFGCAGRGIHASVLSRTEGITSGPIGIVDPRLPTERDGFEVFACPGDVAGFDPSHTVVHVATPPDQRFGVIQSFSVRGFRFFIAEKPLVTTLADLDRLRVELTRHLEWGEPWRSRQALEVIAELRPAKAYLTHMSHELEHDATNRSLPPNVELAYDGLKFTF